MMIDRNRTFHVHDEKLALEIFNNIKTHHIKLFDMLVVKFEAKNLQSIYLNFIMHNMNLMKN
ncbi:MULTISPECIES: hypothetical protein [Clostridium]|jgi:hypothetical protein|uniref:Uncharacterized protein n=1 Tax=Clostridium lapidicellarium TaxID=3240931 RepID=A0ABV4DT34_9CLOT|nr:hypothetical protein [uncultured Clostridium sp.]